MKNKTVVVVTCLSFATLISCNGQKGGGNVSLKTQADSVAYAIGTSIGGSMKKDALDSLDLDILKEGIKVALRGDSLLIDQGKSQMVIQSYLQDKQKQKGAVIIEAGKKFLAENKTKPGVKETADGLQYLVVKEGTGAMPIIGDTVIVHYHGTLVDGTVFDSSVERGEPYETTLTQVIRGWTEALQLMKAGSKWKLFIPAELAYGEQSRGAKLPAYSTLLFDLELISIKGRK